MGYFDNKKVVVTGGSSGIGFGIAKLFAENGATVILIARNAEKLEGAYKKIQDINSHVYKYACDVSNPSEIEDTCEKICKEVGVPDVLANVAGGFTEKISWDKITPEVLEQSMRTNLFSGFYFTKFFAGAMKDNSVKGSIVNIGSSSALQVKRGRIQYTLSKSGVHTMTKVLALDLAQYGIRVNSIAPGPTKTEKIEKRFDDPKLREQELKRMKSIPLGRLADVEEIANTVYFLASDKASFITGVVLPVDGGYTVGIY